MKLAVTSDLHLPITSVQALAALGREMSAYGADALVIAGDVAESLHHLRRCLDTFHQIMHCPIWVLPGNHDLWKRDAPSEQLWEELLPRSVAEAGCHWLEGRSFTIGGVAVAGTVAWYDYSAADPAIETAADMFARFKHVYNMDAEMIDWRWTDAEFAAIVARPFLAELDRLEADAEVRQTVVVTHVPVVECQMYRKPNDRDWNFSNAYFGNLTLGQQVLARKKVTHILSGHTHVERSGQVQSVAGRTVEARVLASEYTRPAWIGLTLGS